MLRPILNGEFLVFEGDLLVFTNRLIDLQHGSHDVLVRGFVSAHEVHFVLKLFDLIIAAQIFNCRKQMFFLALGDELGSSDALSQEAKFLKVIGTAADLVAVLGCIVFHFIAKQISFFNLQFIQIEVDFLVQKGENVINVTLDGVPFGSDAVMSQVFLDVLQLKGMVFVRLLQKDVPNQEGLVFLSFPLASWLFCYCFFLLRQPL